MQNINYTLEQKVVNTVSEYLTQLQIKDLYTTTIEDLQSQSLEIYFLADNRDLKESNVKDKMKSIKEEGLQSPLHLIPASMAIKQKLKIIDKNGSEVSAEQAEKGFIIKDGNNRYKAIMRLREQKEGAGKGADPIHCMIDVRDCDILKTVIAMNNHSVKWDAKDYTKTALGQNPTNETLLFIKELQNLKYSNSTISMILCGDNNLTKVLPLVVTDITKLPNTCKLERAKDFISVAREIGYPDKYIAKRYLIGEFFKLIKAEFKSDEIFDAMEQMTETEVKFSMENNNFDVIGNYLNA